LDLDGKPKTQKNPKNPLNSKSKNPLNSKSKSDFFWIFKEINAKPLKFFA
jgi:hypothetical protein